MEIRGLRADEIEDVVALQVAVFGPGGLDYFHRHIVDDSSFRADQIRVAVVDGRFVSMVRVCDRTMRIGASRVRLGGLGEVCTLPAYRSRGYSSAVLREAVRYLESEGYDLSLLYGKLVRHYGRAGYVPLPQPVITAAIRRVEEPTESYRVRRFDTARDLDAVAAIYDANNVARTGTIVRTPAYWRDAGCRSTGVLPRWVAESSGEIVAYLSGQPGNLHEVAYLADHAAALVPLICRLVNETVEDDRDEVNAYLPLGHPAVAILRRLSDQPLHHHARESMLVRVIHLQPLFEKIRPTLEDRLAAAGWTASASVTIENPGQEVSLAVEPGRLRIGAPAAGGGRSLGAAERFAPGPTRLLQLLFGLAGVDELAESLAADGSLPPPPIPALLRVLFPRTGFTQWPADHF
jgi:predicted N-acetyltransferase YhbS